LGKTPTTPSSRKQPHCCTRWRTTTPSSTATNGSRSPPPSRSRYGVQLRSSNDAAYDFVIAVATGELEQVDAIAAVPQTQPCSTTLRFARGFAPSPKRHCLRDCRSSPRAEAAEVNSPNACGKTRAGHARIGSSLLLSSAGRAATSTIESRCSLNPKALLSRDRGHAQAADAQPTNHPTFMRRQVSRLRLDLPRISPDARLCICPGCGRVGGRRLSRTAEPTGLVSSRRPYRDLCPQEVPGLRPATPPQRAPRKPRLRRP
jgi:hypothetical protein